MHFSPKVAPIQVTVLPLSKKLGEKAQEVMNTLMSDFTVDYDETGSIGKRYRRQDAVGTPYVITVDFDTLEDETVTLRYRDSMEQVRVSLAQAQEIMLKEIKG